MSIGLAYLGAKAVEYRATLDWITRQLSNIPTVASRHAHISEQLKRRIAEAEARISHLRMITRLNVAALVPRGVSLVNQLQFDVYLLSESYLPALTKETSHEIEFGLVAAKAARRCGLLDVEEILVSLSGGHAILPVFPSCPLLFAPPHQRFTLLDLPGMYHEFAHIVFGQQQMIGNAVARGLNDYLRSLERAAGFLNPSEREERRKQIARAAGYWNSSRLNEIFSDIFATYLTGPAYYYSCVDMAIRYPNKPFEIDVTDVHPPMAARVWVCKNALPPEQQKSEIAQKSLGLWEEHVKSKPSSSEFRLFCSDGLLECIVNASFAAVSGLGKFPRYNRNTFDTQMTLSSDMNLEDLLNVSVLNLLQNPEGYTAWEQPFIEALFQ
jgi:hypothetical protein